jgi:hypothetical protein
MSAPTYSRHPTFLDFYYRGMRRDLWTKFAGSCSVPTIIVIPRKFIQEYALLIWNVFGC